MLALVVSGAGGVAGAELAAFCSVDVTGAGSVDEGPVVAGPVVAGPVVAGSTTRGAGALAVVSGGFTAVVGDAGATDVMTGAVVGATVCGACAGVSVWV